MGSPITSRGGVSAGWWAEPTLRARGAASAGGEDGGETSAAGSREVRAHDRLHDVLDHVPEAGGLQDEEVAEEEHGAGRRDHQAEAGFLVHEGADDAEAVEGGDGDEVEDDRE